MTRSGTTDDVRMLPAMTKRVRRNPVMSVEVPQDLIDWIDAQDRASPERLGRSYYVRQALRAYRLGGPERIQELIERLDAAQDKAAAPKVDYRIIQLAEEIFRLPRPALAKFAEFADLFFGNWAARQNADGTMRSPLGRVLNTLLEAPHTEDSTPTGSRARRRKQS